MSAVMNKQSVCAVTNNVYMWSALMNTKYVCSDEQTKHVCSGEQKHVCSDEQKHVCSDEQSMSAVMNKDNQY